MISTIELVFPVVLIFLTGIILKKLKILKKDDGDLFLKLIYYVGAPCLIFNSLLLVKLSWDLIIFPITAGLLIILSFFTAGIANRFLKFKKSTRGIFFITSMMINTGFTLPFLIAGFGTEGVIRYALFDMVSTTLAYTWVYAIACHHNPSGYTHKIIFKKLLTSPLIWAVFIGFIINLSGLKVPDTVFLFTKSIGAIVGPLFMIPLGLYFELKIIYILPTLSALIIRMGLGIAIGFIITSLFGITGINRQMFILLSSSPIAVASITFAVLEDLDKELAASIVSIGLLIGIILTPLLMIILRL